MDRYIDAAIYAVFELLVWTIAIAVMVVTGPWSFACGVYRGFRDYLPPLLKARKVFKAQERMTRR